MMQYDRADFRSGKAKFVGHTPYFPRASTQHERKSACQKTTKKARLMASLFRVIKILHSAGDLTAAQAASACINMLGTSVHDGLDALHIGLPSTVGASVGMGNLNTKGYALVAKLTFCHY